MIAPHSFHRLTEQPDHHLACTAEGGTGQGNPRLRLEHDFREKTEAGPRRIMVLR